MVSVFALPQSPFPWGQTQSVQPPALPVGGRGVPCSRASWDYPGSAAHPVPSRVLGMGVKPLVTVKLSCCLGLCMCAPRITYLVMGFCHLRQPLTLLI